MSKEFVLPVGSTTVDGINAFFGQVVLVLQTRGEKPTVAIGVLKEVFADKCFLSPVNIASGHSIVSALMSYDHACSSGMFVPLGESSGTTWYAGESLWKLCEAIASRQFTEEGEEGLYALLDVFSSLQINMKAAPWPMEHRSPKFQKVWAKYLKARQFTIVHTLDELVRDANGVETPEISELLEKAKLWGINTSIFIAKLENDAHYAHMIREKFAKYE